MRNLLVLLGTTMLAACGGGGPTTVGGSAVPGGGGSGGVGGGVGGGQTGSGHTFVVPTEQKTYQAIGGAHSYQYSTDELFVPGSGASGQYNELYAGNASTARDSGITVDYNPRDAIFALTIREPLGNVDQTLRFQDPVHRTDFGGARAPQPATPDIPNRGINYLEAGTSSGTPGTAGFIADSFTFFYQKPGTTTRYVTYAGYLRNKTTLVQVDPGGGAMAYLRTDHDRDRAAFAYGERSGNNAVPRTGSGTYTGDMLATMVYNPLPDTQLDDPSYFQFISGSSTTTFDFAASSFSVNLTGTVFAPQFDNQSSRTFTIQNGATFTAAGAGRIDLVNAGGFLGAINSAQFAQPGGTFPVSIAGSSVDGAFFGPAAEEVGGGFRIVGGTPDERIDIHGAFTGKKP